MQGVSSSLTGIEPRSPALAGRFLTTEPPGQSLLLTVGQTAVSSAGAVTVPAWVWVVLIGNTPGHQ